MDIPINLTTLVFAFLPIIIILILMIRFRLSASVAGPIGWLAAIIVAKVVFQASFNILINSSTKGLLMSFHVLYIVWGALLLYHVVNEVGGIESIGATFCRMTDNQTLQLLMIAFAFATFLQGVAGFGVPVAVCAPLLIGLGFAAETAVTAALIGHAWAVTFGDMAASFTSIVKVTGLASKYLAPYAAFLIAIAGICCAFSVILCYGGRKVIRHNWLPVFIVSIAMSGSLWAIALWQPSLATFMSGMVGMVVVGLLSRFNTFDSAASGTELATAGSNNSTGSLNQKMDFNLAFSAYYALIIIVLMVSFLPGLEAKLKNILVFEVSFEQYSTGYNWVTSADIFSQSIFGHPGAFLILSSIIGIVLYSWFGFWKCNSLAKVARRVIKSGVGSSIATCFMVLMAFVMVESGMTFTLAKCVSEVFGSLFPVFAPMVGVLGAFVTGSNTNSNVMFGAFQVQLAQLIGFSPYIMAAAQTAGGSIGSMIAPAKVIVGTSTVGLAGQEGKIISKTLKYCGGTALILGFITMVLIFFL